jgi:hypothetical protein
MPNPPLAGRPPYATDEDDSVYLNTPSPARRRPAKPVQNQEREISQYAAYDDYFEDQRASGHGGVGMGMMTGGMDDSDDEDDRRAPAPRSKASPIQAPAPVARSEKQMPSPQQQRPPQGGPQGRPPMQQGPPGAGGPPGYDQHPNTRQATRGPPTELRVQIPQPQPIHAPAPAFMAPPSPSPSMLTPHPLDHPTTPITPVFARPSMDTSRENVKFQEPILRGNSEDRLIPRGGPQKDDFWRRFSMVAKDEARKAPKEKQSNFLKDYEGGNKRKKRIVWFVAIVLLLCIGGAVGLGWYFTHNKPSAQPKAIGGKSNETTHDTLPPSGKPSTSKASFAPIEGVTSTTARVLPPAPTLPTVRLRRADSMGRYHHRRDVVDLGW